MSKTLFSRVRDLLRANIHGIIDAAEDPEKMIDQMIRDFTANIQEAESSIATTIGNLRMLEEDFEENTKASEEWNRKAEAAATRSKQFREEGNEADAKKFEDLARIALQRQLDYEKSAQGLKPTIDSQTQIVEQLKEGLNGMKNRLEELRTKRDELRSRNRVVKAQSEVHDAIKNIDFNDPTSEINRFEEKIRREEARVRGQQELQASSLDSMFNELETDEQDVEVESRLANLLNK